jgi:hypothetical protein
VGPGLEYFEITLEVILLQKVHSCSGRSLRCVCVQSKRSSWPWYKEQGGCTAKK